MCFFKRKTAYEVRISDWSSDVCSSDLTMAMPHLMFYAPGVTNGDIGAKPDLADHASLAWPFIDRQGIAQQSYMIQMLGAAEKAAILADEKQRKEAHSVGKECGSTF